MRLVALALLLASTPILADEGELAVGVSAALEAAWLRHPLAGAEVTIDGRTAFALIPRVGTALRFGITNELQLGGALDVAGIPNVITNEIGVGGAVGQLVTGVYAELSAPVGVFWRIDSGFDASAVLGLEAGPILTLWSSNALADPTKLDSAGRPARLPVNVGDDVNAGIIVRASTAADVRFGDIVLRVVPYAAVAWAATPSARIGVVIEPSLLLSPAPL